MLIHVVPEEDDQLIDKLEEWITSGAKRESSLTNAARGAEHQDWLESHIERYLAHLEKCPRRLTVITVTEEKQASKWRELLHMYSQRAAIVCSDKNIYRSQLDFRLVTISRVQSEIVNTSISPLSKIYRLVVGFAIGLRKKCLNLLT